MSICKDTEILPDLAFLGSQVNNSKPKIEK